MNMNEIKDRAVAAAAAFDWKKTPIVILVILALTSKVTWWLLALCALALALAVALATIALWSFAIGSVCFVVYGWGREQLFPPRTERRKVDEYSFLLTSPEPTSAITSVVAANESMRETVASPKKAASPRKTKSKAKKAPVKNKKKATKATSK